MERFDKATRSSSKNDSTQAELETTLAKVDLETADKDTLAVVAELRLSEVRHARPVPVSPSYFARATNFSDLFVEVQDLLDKYADLPTAPKSRAPRMAWMKVEDHRAAAGEDIRLTDFSTAIGIVKRLNRIDPGLKPQEVTTALAKWAKQIDPWANKPKPIPIDQHGRALGVGKRKESTAQAWVIEGTGEVFVNGKNLVDAFGRVHDRESAVWALYATERMDRYNVWAVVRGGGPTGQSEAMAMAVAKALIAHEPALKPFLRKGG
jgi:small subunit ribosomal protein S9